MRFPCLGLAFLLLTVFLNDTVVHAQRRTPNQTRGAAIRPRSLRGSGQLMGIKPGLMQVRAADGEVWLMKIDARPENVLVQGNAVPSWLRSGMFVRFSANLDSKGVGKEPIDELFVFTPRPGLQIGVFPESDQPLGGAEQQAPKRTRRRRSGMPEGRYLVAGRLVGMRGGEIRVTAGSASVRARLGDKPNIRVDVMGDYSLARQGDKVDYIGKFYEKGRASAEQLTFTAAAPLGSEAEAAAQKKSARARSGRATAQEKASAKKKKPAGGAPSSSPNS